MHVLFTAININSRYAYAYYGKNKETSTILKFLEQFKKESKEILPPSENIRPFVKMG